MNASGQEKKIPSGGPSKKLSGTASSTKSTKSGKSAQSIGHSESGSGIDSDNPASSHADSERPAPAKQINPKELKDSPKAVEDVDQHLRDKRFELAQVYHLLSALKYYCDDDWDANEPHATDAANVLVQAISSDEEVQKYNNKVAKGVSLAKLAERDVKEAEAGKDPKDINPFFSIKASTRYNNWKPGV